MNQNIVEVGPHGGLFKNDTNFIEDLKAIISSELQLPLDVDWWFYRVNKFNCCALDFCDVSAKSFSITIHITGRLLTTDVRTFTKGTNHIELEVNDAVDAIFIGQQILQHLNVTSLLLENNEITFYRHQL